MNYELSTLFKSGSTGYDVLHSGTYKLCGLILKYYKEQIYSEQEGN